MRSIADIVRDLDQRASQYEIGNLQEYRRKIKSLAVLPTRFLFRTANHDNWAHHYGGREELQFNVGYEDVEGDGKRFRHGVAFSFQPSRSLLDIVSLSRKVPRFNEFIAQHLDDLSDFEMWHWSGRKNSRVCSETYPIAQIPVDHVALGQFIFLGRACAPEQIDLERILSDFDRLLPLYLFTEGDDRPQILETPSNGSTSILFRAGCKRRVKWTTASQVAKNIDVNLRHSAIQQALYDGLAIEYGAENVGTENTCVNGGRIDVVVKRGQSITIYEIKTASAARGCIREAIGQLLDYAVWPVQSSATGIFAVGEPPLTDDAARYLERLNKQFPVRIGYIQIQPTD